jgi:PII-like signaling protein
MPTTGGDMLLMRIFVGEADRHGNIALYDALVDFFQKHGFAGATVLRGIAGFGARSTVHRDKLLELAHDLPIVVEVVDRQEKFDQFMPHLEEMMQKGGMITIEKVTVIMYGTPQQDPGRVSHGFPSERRP